MRNWIHTETLKTVIIYVLLTLVLGGFLWLTHLRFNDVEKARCEAWAWDACQKINK